MLGFTCPCPVPPISPCLKRYESHLRRESKIMLSQNSKYENVNTNFESMDYEVFQNELSQEEKRKYGLFLGLSLAMQRTIAITLVGILSGMCGGFLEITQEHVLLTKFNFLRRQFEDYYDQTNMYLYLFSCWFLLTLIPAMIGCLLVVFIEPAAAGGGMPGILAYLNGVNVPRLIKLRVLIVKFFSTLCMLTANLVGGKEGPLVHMGVILGGSVPMMHIPFTKIRFFRLLHSDRERRNMASAGIASGLTAAFSTPVGGVIAALEEGLTYWTVQLTTNILFCALVTSIVVATVISLLLHRCFGCAEDKELLFLSTARASEPMDYTLSEIPMFLFVGIIGGLMGSLWNCFVLQMCSYRLKYIKTKLSKILDLVAVASVTGILSFLIIVLETDCVRFSENTKEHLEKFTIKLEMHCPSGTVPVVAIFFFASDPIVMSALISDGALIGLKALLYVAVYFFAMSIITTGSSISVGIFVPNLLLGGTWGRLLAECVLYISPESKGWCRPIKYAFLGAGSQLCGTTRICFSLGIMMLESNGTITFGLPIFIVLIATKFVADMLTHPIYHAECLMKGMPLLQSTPPVFCSWIEIKDVMHKPVIAFPETTTVRDIAQVLHDTTHNGFPVVDPAHSSNEHGMVSSGQLIGLVLRSQLLIILKKKLYKLDPTSDEFLTILRNHYGDDLKISDIKHLQEDESEFVDLSRFMNQSPIFVQMGTSLATAYTLMAGLGIRHLIVVNTSNEVVGIVTRKDLAVYRTELTCCTVDTKVIPYVH